MTEAGIACPVCGLGTLDPERVDPQSGLLTGTCGHVTYAGYLAELEYLRRREAWLTDRLQAGDPPPPPDLAAAYGVWTVGSQPGQVQGGHAAPPGGPPRGQPRPGRARGHGLQGVLLTLGALLLAVAAVVFTAVAWPRLGAAGQVGLVLMTTGGTAAAAVALRERLHGTAEALAALAIGLCLVTAAAAPGLGVLPRAWSAPDSGYWSVVLLTLGVVAVAAARRWSLRAWSWTGWPVLAAGVLVTAVTVASALGGSPAAYAWGAGGAAVLGVAMATLTEWDDGLRDQRGPTVLAGVGLVLAAGSVVAGAALSREAVPAAAGASALTGLAMVVSDRRTARTRGTGGALGVLGTLGLVLVAAAAGVALAALPAVLATALAAALLGAAVLLVGARLGRARVALGAAVALWLGWLVVSGTPGAAATPTPPPDRDGVAAFLLLVGLALLLAAWLERRDALVRLAAWPGALAAFVALALLAPTDYPEVVEAWSLPLAALLAVAGAASCAGLARSSGERWGPAVLVALVPSALATWGAPWVTGSADDTGAGALVRLALVLAVSAAVLVAGVRLRSLGLVVPAGIALTLAALAQLWTGLQALPRWLALALVGAALVGAGARFEWVRGEGRRAREWVRDLH